MSDGDPISTGMCNAILKLLVRADLVAEDAVLEVAEEYDLLASRSRHDSERERNERIAHLLRCAMMEVEPPPAVDPAVEFEAEFRRRQMVERTAHLAGQSEQPE